MAAKAKARMATNPPSKGGDEMADEYGEMTDAGDTCVISQLPLECGTSLSNCEIRYKTWGVLNSNRDNVLVVCHALSGNADLESWWGSLLGPGKSMDTSRFFVFCSNVLGSCYGSTGPHSINPATGKRYGSTFPRVTIRDMVSAQAHVLRTLGVTSVVCVIGGSMGGMQALEYALTVEHPPTRSIASLCSNGRHHPWQIGISECQRQAIRADPDWRGGDYEPSAPPKAGMAVARMMAMVTYRTHPAYWTKFGRDTHDRPSHEQEVFQVEGYLRSQGEKFLLRKFEPVSYVALTEAMDTHDVERGRGDYFDVLQSIQIPALIVSITSDVLYPPDEQMELANNIPNAQHHTIQSWEGHDGFLLEDKKVGTLLRGFLAQIAPRSSL
mmetsp:Transcript_31797/g.69573  ORF Transcript_31797/g.69573 Transcript_31797/m.69573 type:complete len:383 (+) Transcript_31797:56-1204(+)|eukprot:CAMPEP_0204270874 /NCGR_PEP_ID=MMETSP0468-20130131/19133_1 /ASSEMBLY_ACC=CAM_ASM_000383 /TAXON_ID=2969 /ORGANISM="Oxyrrhis marina" /LENGTH=382 /DNA_ID=CAMNT_0051246459 /DNA_START=32 /DNA_END=1180 /DNA_ORIENTATION=-